jgi:YebC/PmpR family DNA-binding regulatory protein
MSGHSKWENIKRRKEAEDKKRSQIFSKFAKAIVGAIKEGGSSDLAANSRLRMVIEQAKAANMPKENIERLLRQAREKKDNLLSFSLEGYGPAGVAVFLEAVSDNRQRTLQEIKNIFQHHGGGLAEPGSVAFQFNKRGVVVVKKPSEEKMLELLELGAEDFEEKNDRLLFYLAPSKLEEFRQGAEKLEVEVISADLVMLPKTWLNLTDPRELKEVSSFLQELRNHEDVQHVFSNFPDNG